MEITLKWIRQNSPLILVINLKMYYQSYTSKKPKSNLF